MTLCLTLCLTWAQLARCSPGRVVLTGCGNSRQEGRVGCKALPKACGVRRCQRQSGGCPTHRHHAAVSLRPSPHAAGRPSRASPVRQHGLACHGGRWWVVGWMSGSWRRCCLESWGSWPLPGRPSPSAEDLGAALLSCRPSGVRQSTRWHRSEGEHMPWIHYYIQHISV